MNATETHAVNQYASEWARKVAANSSFSETIGAFCVIILAIVALAGVLAHALAAIATIVVGAAILIEGGALTSEYNQLSSRMSAEEMTPVMSGGLTAEFIGGIGGIVLGILALFGTYPETLLAVAVIVFGATFLLASAAITQLTWVLGFQASQARAGGGEPPMPTVNTGGQTLVGLATVVLGILAVIGLAPVTLILVALLSLGVATLFSGGRVGSPLMAAGHK